MLHYSASCEQSCIYPLHSEFHLYTIIVLNGNKSLLLLHKGYQFCKYVSEDADMLTITML